MKFTLKQLALFEQIDRLGSLSLAAEQQCITQSAASMALAQLEKQLGQPLFVRQGRQLVLSPWGNWLKPRAQQLLQQAEQISLGFAQQQLLSGRLQLAASQTVADFLVPELIARMDQEYPDLVLELSVGNTQEVMQRVLDHQADLGLIEGRCDHAALEQKLWCSDQLVIIASPQHPLAKLQLVSLTQLEQASWVLREPGAGTRTAFDAAIHGKLAPLKVHREYSHLPTLIRMVASNNYLSCLPYRTIAQAIALEEVVRLPVKDLVIERNLSFIWRRDISSHPLRQASLQLALSISPDWQMS